MKSKKLLECTLDGCQGEFYAKGYCGKHYRRLKLYGDPLGKPKPIQRPRITHCGVEGCGYSRGYITKGLCQKHYARLRKNGHTGVQSWVPEKHGHAANGHSPTYVTWNNMRRRCYNKKHISYPNYGGRGIKVCERWLHSFKNFLADMGEKPQGLSIDRKDNDGDYEPGNCRWATKEQQTLNRRPRKKS